MANLCPSIRKAKIANSSRISITYQLLYLVLQLMFEHLHEIDVVKKIWRSTTRFVL